MGKGVNFVAWWKHQICQKWVELPKEEAQKVFFLLDHLLVPNSVVALLLKVIQLLITDYATTSSTTLFKN